MVGVAVLTAGVVVALWWGGTRGLEGKDLVSARLDALKTGLGIGVGGGGLFGLYLAWRRQRSTEADLDNRERALAHQQQVAVETKAHQERVAAATEANQDRVATTTETNAAAQRITDLYTKAVEQLGSDKAPVRLGGLYALERLAQDHPDQRQTIVNVLCAYLRMPYTMPGDPPADDADTKLIDTHRERVQEREVRLTAQRILAHHLRPGPDRDNPVTTHWADIDLDLTGAVLINLDLTRTSIRAASFGEAWFSGAARFGGAWFSGAARFGKARFSGIAGFGEARFSGTAGFGKARFSDTAEFGGAWFSGIAGFGEARFSGVAGFGGARFSGPTWFGGAWFSGIAGFSGVRFSGDAEFNGAQFSRNVPEEVKHYL
ncbi:pentapeptide repeat-containing protein [Actinokineospora sp. PR83]|uniref:pentapeptide repeat-containing protein n=1 Tax=Actinokineospora sp. PR83 TaxID=2884908 RepID=UPI0027E010FB|nr:pentapeptide repeat-containing protein [Actinokineospora sp. PR83]MCG8920641.1 pentapeptide repeat-containing protein [Actinokineospora sp. PR83]